MSSAIAAWEASEFAGEHLLVVERRPDEKQRAELLAAQAERKLHAVLAHERIAAVHDGAALDAQPRTGRAGRLDRRLDDHVEQLVDVVRRRERLAEAGVRIAQPVPLLVQLRQPCLKLVRHVVERRREHRELVAPAHRHALRQAAARDPVRRLGQSAERADDRPALEIRDDGDEQQRREQPEQEPVAGGGVGRVDQRLRAEHGEANVGTIAGRRRNESPVALAGHADRLCPSGRERDRAVHVRRGRHDLRSFERDENVRRREPGARAHRVDERHVVRDVAVDGADEAYAREDLDLALRGESRRRADLERVGGADDIDPGRVAQRLPQVGDVHALELDLEGAVAGERLRRALRRVELLLVRGEGRAEACLETGVDAARLALSRDRREPPEGGRDREQREQHEVDDQLDLETPQCCAHHFPDTCCAGRPRRYLDRVMLSADPWTNMRGIERVVAAILLAGAVVGAAAFTHLLGRNPDIAVQLGLPKPGQPGIVQAAPLPAGALALPPAPPGTLSGPGASLAVAPGLANIFRLRPAVPTVPRRVPPAPTTAPPTPAAPTPAPAAPAPQPAAPAPTPSTPTQPTPTQPTPTQPTPTQPTPTQPTQTEPTAVPVPPKPVPVPTVPPKPVSPPPVSHPALPVPPLAAPPAIVVSKPLLGPPSTPAPTPGPVLPVDRTPDPTAPSAPTQGTSDTGDGGNG